MLFFLVLICTLIPPSEAIACTQGQFYTLPSSVCTQCPAGTYCPLSGGCFSNCTQCPPNSGSMPGASTCLGPFCQTCPPGFYCGGGILLQGCPTGTYSSMSSLYSSAQCVQCAAGTFAPAINSTFCRSCLTGTYASGSANMKCASCSSGTFLTFSGASTCLLCTPGTYTTAQGLSTSCTLCGPGTLQASSGSSACQMCIPGSYSTAYGLANASGCVFCRVLLVRKWIQSGFMPPVLTRILSAVCRIHCLSCLWHW